MRLHALILAGGAGSRLGGARKAELRIGGITLLARVAARLASADPPLLLADAGRGRALLAADMVSLADPPGAAGPLAGLRAGLAQLRAAADEDVLVTVAVDTPFLPADYTELLLAPLRAGARASHAAYGASAYPTNAAYRLGALRTKALDTPPTAGPRTLLAALSAVAVDWSGLVPADPFASLNSLDDLVALGRRARAEAA